MNNQFYKHSDLTQRIIGCAMLVHSQMKNGYPEIIYHRCLSIEFGKRGLVFQSEKEVNVFYENIIVGNRRVDFLVENVVVVEIKSNKELEASHLTQTLNCLEAFNLEVGLLINFGAKSLQFRRLINNKALNK